MTWEVEVSDEFIQWYDGLNEQEGVSVDSAVDMLQEYGPALGRLYVDTLKGSKHTNLKELRVQHRGQPYRILFAFDPRRNAYLILGGNKTGDDRWYEKNVPKADALYERHLRELDNEEQ